MKNNRKIAILLGLIASGALVSIQAEWKKDVPGNEDSIRFTLTENAMKKYPTAKVTFKLIRHVPDENSITGLREEVFTQYTLPTIFDRKIIQDIWYKIRPSDFVYPMEPCVQAWEATATLPGNQELKNRGGKIVCKKGKWYRGKMRIKFDLNENGNPMIVSY